jgi:hypothetical protein
VAIAWSSGSTSTRRTRLARIFSFNKAETRSTSSVVNARGKRKSKVA